MEALIKEKPLVSIITVCLNSKRTIEQTINSIIDQTYTKIEYIIVDGKSTDGTCDVIRKYTDYIAKFVSECDDGLYDAMNKGIEISSGEIIGIVNSDDWLEPDAVEEVVKTFDRKNVDIVCGSINVFRENTFWKVMKTKVVSDSVWYGMPVNHPATFVRRTVYNRIGTFSTDYSIASDYDFIIRCYLYGLRFEYTDKVLSNYRLSGISFRERYKSAIEQLELVKKYARMMEKYEDYYRFHYEIIKREKFRELLGKKTDALIENLLDMMDQTTEIDLWGIGEWGKMCYSVLSNSKFVIRNIVDTYSAGKKYEDHIIKKPIAIKGMTRPVLVATIKMKKDDIPNFMSNRKVVFLTDWIETSSRSYTSILFKAAANPILSV